MDLWKRARRILCVATMLALIVAGSVAWVRWGVPEAPFGFTPAPSRSGQFYPVARSANPLHELRLCGNTLLIEDRPFSGPILIDPEPENRP